MKLVVPKIFATFATLVALGGAPASAQYAPALESFLPPYEILTIVRSMGFDPVSAPVLRGPVYVVRAMDDDAIAVRVAVDARSGRIVRVTDMAGWHAGRFGAYTLPPETVPPGASYRPAPRIGPEGRPPRAPLQPKAAAGIPLPRPAPPQIRIATASPAPAPALSPGIAAAMEDHGSGSGKSVPAPVGNRSSSTDVADHAPARADSSPDQAAITGAITSTRVRAGSAFPQLRPTEIVPVAPLD